MDDIKVFKKAVTTGPVQAIIKERWSPRAFAAQPVSQQDLETIFEAASWAPSASNKQPWHYYYANNNTEGFWSLHDCLSIGNKPWTRNAAVLLVACAVDENVNETAPHDLGLANANLLLQATSMGIYGHPMAGFNKGLVAKKLELSDSIKPVCMIALGYLGDVNFLEEPFKTREWTTRTRKSVDEITTNI